LTSWKSGPSALLNWRLCPLSKGNHIPQVEALLLS
jgi:hypothetical protein